MAVVESISKAAARYTELAVQVFLLMIKDTGNRALVHWIVDTYPEVSIKQVEKRHREIILGGALRYTIRSGSQRVPSQLKRALRMDPTKKNLLDSSSKLGSKMSTSNTLATVLCISQQELSASS